MVFSLLSVVVLQLTMLTTGGEGFTIAIPPPEIDYQELERLVAATASPSSLHPLDGVGGGLLPPSNTDGHPQTYEHFLADVWVGIVLTLLVLSCVCCMCSCLLYHKFQQWKSNMLATRNPTRMDQNDIGIETGLGTIGTTEVDLPSYTIASGLPSYQEALNQLKVIQQSKNDPNNKQLQRNEQYQQIPQLTTISVIELFRNCRNSDDNNLTATTTTTPTTTKPIIDR